ncbi:MAG: 1-deoxy-D-xylulose-5-phosphate synthase [Pirellulaceae bacterium]|jgi:1-deoxy-D-xylulose-5-phosphate synthase
MHKILSSLESAESLRGMTVAELNELGHEVRDVLCSLLSERSAHFASNLGVVELCLALHSTYDFRRDRLIWDTGHQIYPHKLVTGRYHDFRSIRTRGGLMGYPNPGESEYDLFMTGHAGSSVSTMLGLRSGDDIQGEQDRHAVAVIGDGAFPSGIVFEALNNLGGSADNMTVILNDNKMSICPRVGGMASYLDKLRTNPFYTGLKSEVVKMLNCVPVFGDPVERMLAQIKEGVKAGLHGGMLFEELGIRYLGPIDGHDIGILKKYLKLAQKQKGPILLHVVTEKGHGFKPAAEDPVFFHAPPAFEKEGEKAVPKPSVSNKSYTHFARDAIGNEMRINDKVTVMTAAMCQGNKLEPVREEFPKRFFDVGICESHAVAFAAGQAKTGIRPIVAIYSTFLQRSFDQIFQEVALQNLPVVFMLDRAGLTAPDGPTHHGSYDFGYLRLFPNMIVMAPGDANDMNPMLTYALKQEAPTSLRYPKATVTTIEREVASVETGKAEVLSWGNDGTILCLGTQLQECVNAAAKLKTEDGLDIGVVNMRFLKPMDEKIVKKAVTETPFVITVEEAALMGGFGSAVLESANTMQLDTSRIRRIGIPDEFVQHGSRDELLADLQLDAEGIAGVCRAMAEVMDLRS